MEIARANLWMPTSHWFLTEVYPTSSSEGVGCDLQNWTII